MIYNSLYGTFENVFGECPKSFKEANNLMSMDKVYKHFQNICEMARNSDCKETLPSFYLKIWLYRSICRTT